MVVRNPSTLIIGAALVLVAASQAAAAPPKAGTEKGAPKAPAAKAEKSKAEKAPPKAKLDVPALQKALESGDEAKTLEALDTVTKSGDPAGAALVEALLGRGASVTVLSRAIETLGIL